jgi:hypothetical protein
MKTRNSAYMQGERRFAMESRHHDTMTTLYTRISTKCDDASRTTSSLRTNHDNEYSIQDPTITTPISSVFCLSLHLSPAISSVGELDHDLTA